MREEKNTDEVRETIEMLDETLQEKKIKIEDKEKLENQRFEATNLCL